MNDEIARNAKNKLVAHLDAMIELAGLDHSSVDADASLLAKRLSNVFVVHGHDDEMKQHVARTLMKLGLNPIILHEQPSSGRTIIEKFEVNAAMFPSLSYFFHRMIWHFL